MAQLAEGNTAPAVPDAAMHKGLAKGRAGAMERVLSRVVCATPAIPLQQDENDCGYACVSAVLAMYGQSLAVPQVRAIGGDTSRGLTLRQLKGVFSRCGVEVEAVMIDLQKSIPAPLVLLLKNGHYVVVGSARENRCKVFYPRVGWTELSRRHLRRSSSGLGLSVTSVTSDDADRRDENATRRAHDPLIAMLGHHMSVRLALRITGIACLSEALALGIPLLSKSLVNSVGTPSSAPLFAWASVLLVLVSGVSVLSTGVSSALARTFERRLSGAVSGRIFDQLTAMPLKWHATRAPTDIYSLVQVIEEQVSAFQSLLSIAGRTLISLVIGIGALFYISPWLAAPGFIAAGLAIAIDLYFKRRIEQAGGRMLTAFQGHRAFVVGVLSQIPLIARFDALWPARMTFKRWTRETVVSRHTSDRIRDAQALASGVLRLAEQVTFVCLAAYSSRKLSLTLGAFVAVGAYKDHLSNSILATFKVWERYVQLGPQRGQARDLLLQRSEPSRARTVLHSGSVRLDGVSFAYGALDPPVLKGVSLSIEPGSLVIFAGPSGAGKTTLAKIIAGLEIPQAGSVLVDGQKPAAGMGGCGSVFQSDCLLEGNIRDNLRVFRKHISDAELLTALEGADLKDFVLSLPMKLDTVVGESRSGLSGGQRQRLLLARALIGAPRLLILDEATSYLDVETEQRIVSRLTRQETTVLMCAHRPEVRRFADDLYVVSGNSVTRAGRHEFPARVRAHSPD